MSEKSEGTPCWADLITRDPRTSQKFYGTLFGWTFQTGSSGEITDYIYAYKDGALVAGLLSSDPDETGAEGWVTYLKVENVEATVNSAAMHAGSIYLNPTYVPTQGSMAMIGEPSGHGVGLWENGEHPEFEARGVPGAPVWHELRSGTFESTTSFYEKVLGWQLRCFNDHREAHYHVLGEHFDLQTAVRDFTHAPEREAGWHIYFQVADIQDALDAVTNLGGHIIKRAHAGTLGLTAEGTDPLGTAFSIVEPVMA